jgi:hypothetical protein
MFKAGTTGNRDSLKITIAMKSLFGCYTIAIPMAQPLETLTKRSYPRRMTEWRKEP